jgi:hypothetical protein
MQSIDDELEVVFREQMMLELMIQAAGATAAVSDALVGRDIRADALLSPLDRATVEMHRDGLKARMDRQLEACAAMFRRVAGNLLRLGRSPLHFSFDIDEPTAPFDAEAGSWLEQARWTYEDMSRAARMMRICIEIAAHRAREIRGADSSES